MQARLLEQDELRHLVRSRQAVARAAAIAAERSGGSGLAREAEACQGALHSQRHKLLEHNRACGLENDADGSLCDSNHTYPFADGSTATPDTPQKHTYDDHVGSSAVGTESFHGSSWKSADGHGASEAQVCFEPDA